MKFKFKVQQYQTDAVENTVAVFHGQPSLSLAQYRRDQGRYAQSSLNIDEFGYSNPQINLDDKTLLSNINNIQALSDIEPSIKLFEGNGRVSLDIEMETGTGKTYVYIKTMFELNKQYGWSKFIIVVPSIAIREGVAKSFTMLEEHFMEHYGKKARWFVYNSANLQQIDSFSSSADLNVMIINTQAFASSMKEGGTSKESLIFNTERDEFGSRRPVDVIAANRPIIIMDEPQKMEGKATQDGIKRLSPLFVLNYSATHKTQHDTIYALDAYDAYCQRLVKQIYVKGFEVKNLLGTGGYLYLDSIILSPKHPPQARIEIEVKTAGSIVRKSKTFNVYDDLFVESGLAQYENFVITDIVPPRENIHNGYVTFLNGITLSVRQVIGDTNELAMQRAQIRETIKSHFEKERELFKRGIKCLSLFFIDEVKKYKDYDESGNEQKGIFQTIFEEEYADVVAHELTLFDEKYNDYLKQFQPEDVHRGYFSIDKKSNRVIDSKLARKSEFSDDISAYDLILKNKERLLSFEEPTRFIFSHSALSEGWDNPNVFQICTLRHSNSSTRKRQEVGRGLRICVDKNGTRMDAELLGEEVFDINKLTVIANESYESFTKALQADTREALRYRPEKITDASFFTGKNIKIGDSNYVVTERDSSRLFNWLDDNEYIDEAGAITPQCREAIATNNLAELPEKLKSIAECVPDLINSVFDSSVLANMVKEESKATLVNQINANFEKREFKALWNEINHQYVYTVNYNSEELIQKVIGYINAKLNVKKQIYTVTTGAQDINDVLKFSDKHTKNEIINNDSPSTVRYDLVGDIAKAAKLTRRSVVEILRRIEKKKLYYFKANPEEFIRNVSSIIREQKASMIVEAINYNQTEGKYDSDIFTIKSRSDFAKAYEAKKHILDYVFVDSEIERNFAHDMDEADEVVVYAKLPRSFQIPTPVGNYAPDWAIALRKDGVKHIFFIAETKGSMESMQLSAIEAAKINCAEKLFNSISTANVRYHKVASYQDLINAMICV